MGLSGALPPAVLPVLGAEVGLGPATASLVVSTVFAGLCAGVVTAAAVAARLAPGAVLLAGGALQAAGLLLLATGAGAGTALGGAAVLGLGFGATELSATAVVRGLEAVTGRELARRTGLTALTAALAPVALGLLVVVGHWRPLLGAAAAVQVLSAASLLRAGRLPAPSRSGTWRRALRLRAHHLAAAAYVGAETVVVAWVARLLGSALGLAVGGTVAATAAFWIAIALGRRIAARLLSAGTAAGRLLVVVLGGAVVALAVAAATGGVARAVALVLGLVCAGPVYPLILSTAPRSADPQVLAPLIAAGALGGTVISAGGTVAYSAAGLAGVLLLAAAALAVALLACAASSSARRPG
jgi:fucose permease